MTKTIFALVLVAIGLSVAALVYTAKMQQAAAREAVFAAHARQAELESQSRVLPELTALAECLGSGEILSSSPYSSWVVHTSGTHHLSLSITEHLPSDMGDPLYAFLEARGVGFEQLPDPGVYRGEHSHRTVMALDAISSRGSHEWVVAGRRLRPDGKAEPGTAVLELWRLTPADGEAGVMRRVTDAPIGVSAERTSLEFIYSGTEYLTPDVRTAPEEQRFLLYSGSVMGEICSVLMEPEGRFVLALSLTNHVLYRLALDGNSEPSVVATTGTHPFLASAERIWALEHASEGRIYVLESAAARLAGIRLVLKDADKDGVLPDSIEYVDGDWDQSTYADMSKWVDDFVGVTGF